MLLNFLPPNRPYYYHITSTMVFTRPNDGWTDLCIKLCVCVTIYRRTFLFPLQPVEAQCAETLCRMFPLDENIDLKAIAIKARRARRLLERERFYGHRALPPSAAPPPPPPAPRQDIPRLGLLMSGHFARELCDEVWATRVGQSGRSSSTRHNYNYKAGSVCRVV